MLKSKNSISDFAENFSLMSNLKTPIAVSFDITTNCNLKCLHCYNNSGSLSVDSDLTDTEILEVAKQIAELHPFSVCLCGGETLCRKNIFDVLDILKDNISSISLVSNGYIMDDDIVKELKLHKVQQIQISLDGVNKYQHDSFRGVLGSFDRAVNAIKSIKKNRIKRLATSLVPNKLNYRSFDRYIELCYSLGVDNVRMMPLIPSGRGKNIGRKLILSDSEYFNFLLDVQQQIKLYSNKLEIEWGDPLDHMRRMPFNAQNNLNTYCMEIKSNGDITVTTYLPIVVGNCKKYSLKEYWDKGYNLIWKNEKVLHYIEKIQNIYDFDNFEPAPYSGEKIYLDII